MAGTSILGGISQEATQQELLTQATLLLAAILERLPRTDANDRAIVNTSDQGNVTVALAASQTLTTVTTAQDLTRLNRLGTSGTEKPADAIPMHVANIGASHIYNQIIVS